MFHVYMFYVHFALQHSLGFGQTNGLDVCAQQLVIEARFAFVSAMTEAQALRTLTHIGRILRLCELGDVRAESALIAVQHVAAASITADPIARIANATEDPDVKALVLMVATLADKDWEKWAKVQPKFSDPPNCQ